MRSVEKKLTGEEIRKEREALGMSTAQVGRISGWSHQMVYRLEKELRVSAAARRDILQALGIVEDVTPKPRGFACLPPERLAEITSLGGRTAQERGVGHRWTSDTAREAGKRGGCRDPEHMSKIGKRGGRARAAAQGNRAVFVDPVGDAWKVAKRVGEKVCLESADQPGRLRNVPARTFERTYQRAAEA